MIFILIVLNITVIVAIFFCLSWIKKLFSEIEFIKDSFFETKKQLFGLLDFIPLYDIARDLKNSWFFESDEFSRTLKIWEKIELKELENFAAATKTDENAQFAPSNELKHALREWSLHCYKIGLINKWKSSYQTVYCELMGGKITLEEAKSRLKPAFTSSLTFILDSPEAEEIYNDWAKNWSTPGWKERLDFLHEQNKFE